MNNWFRANCKLVLNEILRALEAVDPEQAEALVAELLSAEKVFFIGVGRCLLSLKAFAKRLNHLGISAYCVGDTNEPAITEKDLLVVGSGSGESVVPVAIARVARQQRARLAYIGSNPQSSVALMADVIVRIPVQTKLGLPDEMSSEQIMTSLFEQCLYILGDAFSLEIARRRGLDLRELRRYHANLE